MSADQTSQAAGRAAEAAIDRIVSGSELDPTLKDDIAAVIERECRCKEAREIIEALLPAASHLADQNSHMIETRKAVNAARKFLE
jgi:hypothetical protein